MKTRSILLPAMALVLSLGLAAVAGTTMQASTTTMGQELMDLEQSYKQGIITEKEYNRAKEQILDSTDRLAIQGFASSTWLPAAGHQGNSAGFAVMCTNNTAVA
ncbi:MAG: hypothetical protein H6962_04325 [Chromatiaceae bacterium]|nr:hypothetical protein [Chromatiaceae bacterium]